MASKISKTAGVWVPGGGSIHNPPSDIVDAREKWRYAWGTLKRWQERVRTADAAGKEVASRDIVDFAHVFILFSFQFRDWLIASKHFTRKEMAAIFEKAIVLQACRDIANGLKHLTLNDPSLSKELGLHREYDWGRDVYKITFFVGKEKYDWEALEFISDCMGAWETCLRDKNLIGLTTPKRRPQHAR